MKTKVGHKLGVNRKEAAVHTKKRRTGAESRDVREDRSMRQEKFDRHHSIFLHPHEPEWTGAEVDGREI